MSRFRWLRLRPDGTGFRIQGCYTFRVKRRMHAVMRFVSACAALALLSPLVSQPLVPDTGGTRIGEREVPPNEEAASRMLKELFPVWSAAARRYDTYAQRFLCTETHRNVDYSRSAGEARREKETAYGYLLTLDPKNGSYEVVRQVLDDKKEPTGGERTIDLGGPEPYTWTFLFLPTTVSTTRYRYLGREIQNYRLTHVVSFEGSAPRVEGRDIREWTGKAWVEENTGNLVRIEARPSFQDDRLRALWQEFQQAFVLPLGIKAKARPHGYALAVLFDYDRDGLLFPSRLDLADFVWVAKGREVLDTRLVLTYDDYRFFYTGTQEKIEPPG